MGRFLITVNVENKPSPDATRVVRQGYKRCLTSTFGNADSIFFRDRLRFVNLSWSIALNFTAQVDKEVSLSSSFN